MVRQLLDGKMESDDLFEMYDFICKLNMEEFPTSLKVFLCVCLYEMESYYMFEQPNAQKVKQINEYRNIVSNGIRELLQFPMTNEILQNNLTLVVESTDNNENLLNQNQQPIVPEMVESSNNLEPLDLTEKTDEKPLDLIELFDASQASQSEKNMDVENQHADMEIFTKMISADVRKKVNRKPHVFMTVDSPFNATKLNGTVYVEGKRRSSRLMKK